MQNDTVRSWKAYTTDRTREAGPVQAVDLEDGIYGGMIKPQTYASCALGTHCTECSYGDIC
ncbi:hypothetical protein [Streptomyces sp. NBC_00448]|uniref:hypothetical protein n=1 Tax=Streptomyces sp. NBC_00448 TaxID=2903652 RepID=UPI002E21CAC4